VKYLQHETCLARCMVVAGQNEENNEGSFSIKIYQRGSILE